MVPAFDGLQRLERAPLLSQDQIRGLGPYEWLGVGIVVVEIVVDGALELGDGREGAAPNALFGDVAEPTATRPS